MPQSEWGSPNNTHEYRLFMEGTTPVAELVSLEQHTVSDFSTEKDEPLKYRYEVIVNGRKVIREKIVRGERVISRSFTLVMGEGGKIWTPALQKARRYDEDCETDFFLIRTCSNADDEHAFIWPKARLSAPERSDGALVTMDTGEMIKWQAAGFLEEEYLLFQLGVWKRTSAAMSLYAVAPISEECTNCSDAPNDNWAAAGGDGGVTDDVLLLVTDDRFATVTTVDTTAITDGNIGQCVLTDGDLIIVGYADEVFGTPATAGGILYTADLGATASADATMPATPGPIRALGKWNGIYLAAGGISGGQATLFESVDGADWTAVTATELPATKAITAMAVDEDNDAFYLVGETGLCLKGISSAGAISLSAITLPNISTTDLHSVAALDSKRVAVGGASGYYAESFDGGVVWYQPATVAGASTIFSVEGVGFRAILGAATALSQRDPLQTSKNRYKAKTLEDGATVAGNIQGIAKSNEAIGGANYFVAVTDEAAGGNILVLQPFYPDA